MRTSVREGREFRWSDGGARVREVILNASAEKALFPGGHALGQHVSDDGGKTFLEIVGVVEDAKYSSVRAASPPTIYYPATLAMENGDASLVFMLRVSGPAAPVISSASKVIHQNLPELPAPAAISMEEAVNESLASERILAMLATFFGTLALVITGIGLYGTLAYMTERRTGEIGIRMALGATRGNIAFLVAGKWRARVFRMHSRPYCFVDGVEAGRKFSVRDHASRSAGLWSGCRCGIVGGGYGFGFARGDGDAG